MSIFIPAGSEDEDEELLIFRILEMAIQMKKIFTK